MLELTETWDRLVPAILVGLGALLALGSVLLARVSHYRGPTTADPDDPLGDFRPRSLAEIEAERPRRWPVVGALLGILLVSGGLLSVPPADSSEEATAGTPAPSGSPYLVDVRIASAPSPSPTPSPTPSPSAARATPHSHSPSGSAPSSGGSSGGAPSSGGSTAPAATPTPRPPGPFVEASASCFGDTASISYQVTARSGTVLKILRILLDGRVVHEPDVDGSARHNGQYQQVNTSPGRHTFVIATTASDGGHTRRTYPVTC